MSPRTWGPKNYSGPWVLISYFYFYVHFRATTVVVDGGDIFGIWRVSEEIWVRFFWAKGLGGSWFLFFSWRGGGGGGGVLGVLIGGSEPEWEMRKTGWGDRRGALCTGFILVFYIWLGSFFVSCLSFCINALWTNFHLLEVINGAFIPILILFHDPLELLKTYLVQTLLKWIMSPLSRSPTKKNWLANFITFWFFSSYTCNIINWKTRLITCKGIERCCQTSLPNPNLWHCTSIFIT